MCFPRIILLLYPVFARSLWIPRVEPYDAHGDRSSSILARSQDKLHISFVQYGMNMPEQLTDFLLLIIWDTQGTLLKTSFCIKLRVRPSPVFRDTRRRYSGVLPLPSWLLLTWCKLKGIPARRSNLCGRRPAELLWLDVSTIGGVWPYFWLRPTPLTTNDHSGRSEGECRELLYQFVHSQLQWSTLLLHLRTIKG